MLNTLERNKGFTVILLGAAIVLLILATAGLDSQFLVFTGISSGTNSTRHAAVDRYEELFVHAYFTNLIEGGRSRDVFATSFFNKPKPKPPPKPGTRDVPISYLGAIENSQGHVTAFLHVDDQLQKLSAGDVVVSDWKIASVTGQWLILTNGVPETNSIEFKKAVKVSVPIR